MTRAGIALPLAAALALAACTRTPQPAGPIPVAMTPSQGDGLAALPVVIHGDHFDASAQTAFDEGAGALQATFRARLVHDAGGAAVDLTAVRLTTERKLEASVPPIAIGTYKLEVTDPAGRTGSLARAFRVLNAAGNAVGLRVARLEDAHSGVPFLVELTAVDAGGAVVDGFSGEVQLTDLTGTVAPARPGPLVFGRLTVPVTVTASPLPQSDAITATSLPPLAGLVGTSVPFDVTAGPPVALAFASGPATISAGGCSAPVLVETRDALDNPSPVPATWPGVAVELQSSPAGGLEFHVGGGGCNSQVTSITISPGTSSASFRYTGGAPGTYVIRAVPAGLPSTNFDVTLN